MAELLRRWAAALGGAALLVGAAGCTEPEPEPALRGVVLIVLDTLRADRLGCYGYGRPTSPHLDRLAGRGVRFEQAVATAPWTLPSVASLLAGSYAERVYDGELRQSLVEELRAAGVRTAAFTEGAFVSESYGLGLGFDEWHEEVGAVQLRAAGAGAAAEASPEGGEGGGIERTFSRAERWLARRGTERFFLFLHSYEPHAPYTHRELAAGLDPGRLEGPFTVHHVAALAEGRLELSDGEIEYVRALYDGDVAASDRRLGRFLDELERLGLADEVAVIVTSDHGEQLDLAYPRNVFDHGHSLRDDLMRVPLLLFDPTRPAAAAVVSQQVRTLDVLPTVAELLGVALDPAAYDGRSLLPLLEGGEREGRPVILGQVKAGPLRVGLRAQGYKLIQRVGPEAGEAPALVPPPPEQQLYDLSADPGERHNLAAERPQVARLLLEMLSERHPGQGRSVSPELSHRADPALIERLESLGYLR